MTNAHPDLTAEIAAYCERNGMSRAEFGRRALNDPRLVFDLDQGRELRRSTERRVREFMAEGSDHD